jgi:hypothetical protein
MGRRRKLRLESSAVGGCMHIHIIEVEQKQNSLVFYYEKNNSNNNLALQELQ